MREPVGRNLLSVLAALVVLALRAVLAVPSLLCLLSACCTAHVLVVLIYRRTYTHEYTLGKGVRA